MPCSWATLKESGPRNFGDLTPAPLHSRMWIHSSAILRQFFFFGCRSAYKECPAVSFRVPVCSADAQGEPVSLAQVDKLDLQYTYSEGGMYYFMDTTTFEEVSIEDKFVGEKSGFMLEGMSLSVSTESHPNQVNTHSLASEQRVLVAVETPSVFYNSQSKAILFDFFPPYLSRSNLGFKVPYDSWTAVKNPMRLYQILLYRSTPTYWNQGFGWAFILPLSGAPS